MSKNKWPWNTLRNIKKQKVSVCVCVWERETE